MKKSLTFIGIPLALAILSGLYFFSDNSLSERDRYEQFLLQKATVFSEDAEIQNDELKALDEPDMAAFQEYRKTLDPALGYVPKKRLLKAYKYTTEMEQELKAMDDYDPPLDWTGTGANMGGRTRAIMFDPNDANNNKVWAGGVTGGLWYIDDITSASAQWVAVGDFWSNLAISSIAYDPNSTQTFYVGTGEAETARITYRESSGLGAGIFKTTDGGTTWSLLASTEDFAFITDIAVRDESGISAIYACVASGTYEGPDHESQPSDGVYRSTDGGTTWDQVLPDITGGSDPYTPSDIEIAADGRIFIGTMKNLDGDGGATVLYSDDGTSGSWTIYDYYNGVISSDDNWYIPARTIVAVSPSDPNRVYAQFAGGEEDPYGDGFARDIGRYMAKSEDGGATWSSVPKPADDWSTLAWHCFILQVDPTDPDVLFTGGLDLWKSSNAGSTWDHISDWALMYSGGGDDYVHADQHNIQYKPGTPASAIFSTDGGVFLSTTSDQDFPVFIERNKGYNTLQFYSGAIHPGAGTNNFLAGAQDNGTTLHQGTPVDIDDMISGGDGAFCFWDEDEPDIYITSSQRCIYYVWNNGTRVYYDTDKTGTFICPGDYDYDNNILYSNAVGSTASTKNILYRLSGIPSTNTRQIITIGTSSDVPFSHIAYSPHSPDGTSTLFVGTESGKLYKVTNAESSSTTVEIGDPNFPTSFLSCVAIGATEDDLLVTFSNYGVSSVWLTNDGGATWEEKEANLPDMPIRWAIFHPANNNQALLATEIGVWATNTLNEAVPEWAPAVDGLANVRVDMLRLRKSDNTVLAATHGRGLFYAEYELDGAVTLPYTENFETGLGDCVPNSVSGDTKNRYWDSNNHWPVMNGWNSGDLEEDWLILPGINLDDYSDEIMTFHTQYNFGSDDDNNYLKLMYSSDYPGTGDPNSYTWNELPFTHSGDNNEETWIYSDVVDLSSISGTMVYIAFKYNYDVGNYRRWFVDNIFIREGTPVNVTFQVNMEDETVSGDGVHLAGSFQDWNPSTTEMLDGDTDDVYSVTLLLFADVVYQYKFINGNAWGTEETVPDECRYPNSTDRYEITGETDYSIAAVCFGSCTDCGVLNNYDITFRVNMQEETVTGTVNLAGSFNGWSNTTMTNTSGDIWEVTLSIEENSDPQYKFKNGSDWESPSGDCSTGGGNNRFFTGPTENAILDLVCYNSCDACPPPDLIISEVVSPSDNYLGKFVEFHNTGTSTIDFDSEDFYLAKQVNGGNWYDVKLSGSIAAGASFVLAGYSSDFNSIYGFEADQYDGQINGNGNDGYFLYFGGGYATGVLIDAYGVINEDGLDKDWNYYKTKAVRLRSVTAPNTIWTASEWDIPVEAYTDDMTPSAHNEDVSWLAGATSNSWSTKSSDRWSSPYGYIPDASFNVTIVPSNNEPRIYGQAACSNLLINSDALLFVWPGVPFNVYGDLSIAASKSRDAASFVLASATNGNASVIVDGSVSGTAVVLRYFEGYDDGALNGWHLIGSPVNNMAISGTEFDPTGTDDDLYQWDEASDTWENYKKGHFSNFSNGDGYLFAIQTTDTRAFEGTLNNSDVSKSSLSNDLDGWHILGNPFPSALEWNTTDWAVTGIGASAEIWNESAGNYAVINAGDVIPSTNGFFVQVDNTTNSLTIPLSARVHDATNNYKNSLTEEMDETLVLTITNDVNTYYDVNRIGFKPDATEAWDIKFDAHKLFGRPTAPQLWTVSNDENFAQNYLPYVYDNYQVPLHFRAGVNATYQITAEGLESFYENSDFYLEDLFADKIIKLNDQQLYSFAATTQDDEARFIVYFNGVTSIGESLDIDAVLVYAYSKTIYFKYNTLPKNVSRVEVFNTMGQQVYTGQLTPQNLSSIQLNEKAGIYIVRLKTEKGILTQKVIIK